MLGMFTLHCESKYNLKELTVGLGGGGGGGGSNGRNVGSGGGWDFGWNFFFKHEITNSEVILHDLCGQKSKHLSAIGSINSKYLRKYDIRILLHFCRYDDSNKLLFILSHNFRRISNV